jgi:predicted Zn-ribbon and HTH transcriptional regulator
MEEFIKKIEETREREIDYLKKSKCEDEHNSNLFFYLEGRIGAFSDIILQYYYHYKDKEVKNMTGNIASTTGAKPTRMICANCGYVFEGILYVCPKCGSNAIDKLNVNKPEWIS